jgi:transposase
MRQRQEYPLEFKLEAVRRYLNNGRRMQEIARELGIPSSTLRTWRDK